LRWVNPPFTAATAWQWLRAVTGGPQQQPLILWRTLREISPFMRKAVLAGEDQRFLDHKGFDFVEITEAMRDLFEGGSLRGASTISMQTARTVFLWPSRTFLRKALEAYYTILIEMLWSKSRILEMYLNTVDWGEGLMGVEAAARHYFHRSCAYLSKEQSALLSAVLPSPHRWTPTNPGPRILKRKHRILRDMSKMPLLSSAVFAHFSLSEAPARTCLCEEGAYRYAG